MAKKSSAGIWEDALSRLNDHDRSQVHAVAPTAGTGSVLQDLLTAAESKKDECLKKRWKIVLGDRNVILRDVIEKLSTWAKKFIAIGDTVIQYDAGQAALPWAAIRFLLQVTVNDVVIYGSILQSVELIARLIPSSAILERLYLQQQSPLEMGIRLRNAMVELYAAMLRSLARVIEYYSLSTALRIAKSITTIPKDIDSWSSQIVSHQAEVERLAALAEAEKMEIIKRTLEDLQEDSKGRDEELSRLLQDLHQPIERFDRRLADIDDELKRDQRARILKAISTLPYSAHHKAVAKDRLQGSGKWLTDETKFQAWYNDSSSSVLWLHGIPGSGKTKLASLVVDKLLRNAHVAYFYCMRNPAQPERAQCDKILNSMLRQLASSSPGAPILPPVREKYEAALEGFEDFDDQSWTSEESTEVLIQLSNFYPSITFVVDALDEVNSSDRSELLDRLTSIVNESQSLIKIFISSRDNIDIDLRLQGSPNLHVGANNNSKDIADFVHKQLAAARLLHGTLSDNLRDKISQTLIDGAQGMFRWVDLQIQSLRALKIAADIEAKLGHLPKTLEESYWDILTQIEASGENAAWLARTTFQWLLCARSSITIEVFATLVSIGSHGLHSTFTATEIRDVCANLIISKSVVELSDDEKEKDKTDKEDSARSNFGFAHLSVREFLEGLPGRGVHHFRPAEANAAISSLCLSFLSAILKSSPSDEKELLPGQTKDASSSAEQYVVDYWPDHVGKSERLKEIEPLESQIISFLVEKGDIAPTYRRWCEKKKERGEPPHNLVWFAHSNKIIAIEKLSISEVTLHAEQKSAFIYCAEFGNTEFMDQLLCQGLDLVGVSKDASMRASLKALRYMLDKKAPISPNALYNAITREDWEAVALIFEKGSNPFTPIEMSKALTLAVSNTQIESQLCSRFDRLFLENTQKEPLAVIRALKSGLQWTANRLIRFGFEVKGHYLLERRTALHWSSEQGFADTTSMILEKGVTVNARDRHGDTPLHLATIRGHIKIVSLLLNHGASTLERNIIGRTPLHYAAMRNYPKIMTILREAGSDELGKDHDGWTPLQLAQIYQHTRVVELLDPAKFETQKMEEQLVPNRPTREMKILVSPTVEITAIKTVDSLDTSDSEQYPLPDIPILIIIGESPPHSPISVDNVEEYMHDGYMRLRGIIYTKTSRPGIPPPTI